MYIEELKEGGDGDGDGDVEFSGDGAVVVSDTKRVLVGAGARALFYPTLLYNVVRNKIQNEFRWWDRVDQFILLGAVPFPTDVLRLKELGVYGVVTLNESYETLVPTSLYHDMLEKISRMKAPKSPFSSFWRVLDMLLDICLNSYLHLVEAHGIDHLVIPTRDYLFAPSYDDICKAVEFIHENAFAGKTTYVHCKAGRGRSTTVVLCYLVTTSTSNLRYPLSNFGNHKLAYEKAVWLAINGLIRLSLEVKHRQMTPDAAYEYVKSIRPRVRLAASQWRAVQDYHLRVKEHPKVSTFKTKPDLEPFDDAAVVLVAESDLEGYQESFDNYILAELSLVCRAQFASQAAMARLSCLWLRCHDAVQKIPIPIPTKELGGSEQIQVH